MNTSEQINEIATAGAKAQAELRPAIKDAVNPAFRSKYADYAAIVEAAKVYAKHGIAIWQDVQLREAGGVSVVTRLTHTSGQWIEMGPFTVPVMKQDAHGVGSAATYAKRYALSAALAIAADEDDDGNAAVQRAPSRPVAADPPGYDNWRADLELVATEQGLKALEAAWKKSNDEFKAHTVNVYRTQWEALKARAAKVSAA